MSDDLLPELDRGRHVDLRGRRHQPVARRFVLAALLAISVLGLLNVFGQAATDDTADAAQGTLTVSAPKAIRGGLFFQAKVVIRATRQIDTPTLVLAPGWTEQMQINTIEPNPQNETSTNDRLQLEFRRLRAGDEMTVWLQCEANPLGAGRRDQSLTLLDGNREIARVSRRLTFYP